MQLPMFTAPGHHALHWPLSQYTPTGRRLCSIQTASTDYTRHACGGLPWPRLPYPHPPQKQAAYWIQTQGFGLRRRPLYYCKLGGQMGHGPLAMLYSSILSRQCSMHAIMCMHMVVHCLAGVGMPTGMGAWVHGAKWGRGVLDPRVIQYTGPISDVKAPPFQRASQLSSAVFETLS